MHLLRAHFFVYKIFWAYITLDSAAFILFALNLMLIFGKLELSKKGKHFFMLSINMVSRVLPIFSKF